METHRLIAHPGHAPRAVAGVTVVWDEPGDGWLHLRYTVSGVARLALPKPAAPRRADELWRTTCFELFVQHDEDTGYVECNFSPSRRWAVYDFADYRSGRRERALPGEPVSEPVAGEGEFAHHARLDPAGLPPRPWRVGLSAIIEEDGGAKSYWALAHPSGEPDFHHPVCFALTLPAEALA
ncbi:MAG: DOMON-like domain-containing protein [Novosphingobium sp.]